MAYYTHRSWKPLLLYLGLMFCPHYSQSPSTLTNSTCWAGCCSSPAVQLTGSSEADFIFVNDRCVNVHLCLDLCNHRLFGFFWLFVCLSPHFSCIRVVCDVVSWSRQLSLLCFCPPPFPTSSDALQEYSTKLSFFVTCASVLNLFFLYVVPSVAWGEDGIDELHVVGYVYQELLVCTANFTYIYATSLSTLYSLCLLYTHIQHIE